MAVRLPNSIYIHLMKTGGWSVRVALARMNLNCGEVGRDHDPPGLLPFAAGKRPFTFVFVRHPLSWYRSYWAYRMQAAWQVHPKQPITGWQTFGSVLDHECRSDNFETWVRNVLAYVPEGFLTRIYQVYTDGVDFTGRVEFFKDDFSRALTLAGEKFSPRVIRLLSKKNVTNATWTTAASFTTGLAKKVMAAESFVIEKWDYDYMPGSHVIAVANREIGSSRTKPRLSQCVGRTARRAG